MKIAAVIPVYNGADTLMDSLQSIGVQTRLPDEVILVNDGSKDQSVELAQRWADSHPEINFVLIHQANAGLAAARNRGVRESKCEWIAFLDDDDLWRPQKLEYCEKYLHESRAGVIFHSMENFGGSGKGKSQRLARPLNKASDILLGKTQIVPSSVIVRRELLLKFPFPREAEFRLAEDLFLWLKLLQQGVSFQAIGKNLGRYRDSQGISSDIDAHLSCVIAVIRHFRKQGLYGQKLMDQALSRKHYEAARFYHKQGAFTEAAAHYRLHRGSSLSSQLLKLANKLGLRV